MMVKMAKRYPRIVSRFFMAVFVLYNRNSVAMIPRTIGKSKEKPRGRHLGLPRGFFQKENGALLAVLLLVTLVLIALVLVLLVALILIALVLFAVVLIVLTVVPHEDTSFQDHRVQTLFCPQNKIVMHKFFGKLLLTNHKRPDILARQNKEGACIRLTSSKRAKRLTTFFSNSLRGGLSLRGCQVLVSAFCDFGVEVLRP